MENATLPTILLTDTARFPGTARLAVEFAKSGLSVTALCPIKGNPLEKVGCVQRLLPYNGLRPLESLESAIRAVKPDLIIPSDDRAVQHLHELHWRVHLRVGHGNEISAAIERSLGPSESFPIVSCRYSLLSLAREEGLRVPPTGLISSAEDLMRWRKAHPLPLVLKSDGSWGGRGVRIAHTALEGEMALERLVRTYTAASAFKRMIINRDSFWLRPWWLGRKPPITVQTYIQGRPANCVVACWQGKILAGMALEVICTQGLNCPATVVRVVENAEMLTAAQRIAARLKLSGMFGLDFVIENETGLLYLVEMNPRFTPPCHLRLGGGRDLVGALVSQLTGEPLPEVSSVAIEDVIAYFPGAIQAGSEIPPGAFLDAPEDEPELAHLLLNPWPDRTLSFRLYDSLYRQIALLKSSRAYPLRKSLLKSGRRAGDTAASN